MSDDLVKRLRYVGKNYELAQEVHFDIRQAAPRIEELEAKLVKAMRHVAEYSNDPHLVGWARRNLAELTGGKDE